MLESIEIKNFRCFKETKVSKFGLVNLFGGLNNSGKTALLESIYLTVNCNFHSIMFLHKNVRKGQLSFIRDNPTKTWDDFFYQNNKEEEIALISVSNELETTTIALSSFDRPDNTLHVNFNKNIGNDEIDEFILGLKSILKISVKSEKGNDYFNCEANKSGVISVDMELIPKYAHFILTSAILSPSELANQYDKVCDNDDKKENEFLKAIQIADKSIKKVKTSTLGGGLLRLQRENENAMPIGLFGDAINKIAIFILAIINNPNTTILIDEIENGIHYTKQAELWEMLFKLAIEYNVQIFATSHSLEMIKAFAKVAQQFSEKAAYFEMARSQKTGLIKAIKHDTDTLLFELDRNIAIRGE